MTTTKKCMSDRLFTCEPETSLQEVARTMWDKDCGFVPVVSHDTNELVGVVTDRDICMAAWTKGRTLDKFYAVEDLSEAKDIAEEVRDDQREQKLATKQQVTLDNLFDQISAGAIMSRGVHACSEDDDLKAVHELMREHQVRRLPVVDAKRRPVGVVSMNDLAEQALDKQERPALAEIGRTLGEVSRHRLPALVGHS